MKKTKIPKKPSKMPPPMVKPGMEAKVAKPAMKAPKSLAGKKI